MTDAQEQKELYRCPLCGRYTSPDDGFYDKLDRSDDCSEVACFCDETCADAHHDST